MVASEHTYCIYPGCNIQEKLVSPLFAPVCEIMAALDIEHCDSIFKLCPEHYQELYRQFVSDCPCASCNINPKKGTHFTRHSPNSELVNNILRIAELDGTKPLSPSDYICAYCYKSHLPIVKSLKTKLNWLT